MGIGDWGLGIGPKPQFSKPNTKAPMPNERTHLKLILKNKKKT